MLLKDEDTKNKLNQIRLIRKSGSFDSQIELVNRINTHFKDDEINYQGSCNCDCNCDGTIGCRPPEVNY